MTPRHHFLLFLLCLNTHLTGCHTARPLADARLNAQIVPSMAALDTSSIQLIDNQGWYRQNNDNTLIINNGADKPSLPSRLADAIGLSTPDGRARRHAVKLARASVPRSIGKGAVYAPLAKQVANSYKSDAPTTTADSGAVVSNAAENSQQQNVQGDGNEVSAKQANPQTEAPGVLATIADNLTGPLGYLLAGAAALSLLAWWAKRKNPMA